MKPKQILHGVLAASLAVIGTFGTGLPQLETAIWKEIIQSKMVIL